jgi:hypothetical protein
MVRANKFQWRIYVERVGNAERKVTRSMSDDSFSRSAAADPVMATPERSRCVNIPDL